MIETTSEERDVIEIATVAILATLLATLAIHHISEITVDLNIDILRIAAVDALLCMTIAGIHETVIEETATVVVLRWITTIPLAVRMIFRLLLLTICTTTVIIATIHEVGRHRQCHPDLMVALVMVAMPRHLHHQEHTITTDPLVGIIADHLRRIMISVIKGITNIILRHIVLRHHIVVTAMVVAILTRILGLVMGQAETITLLLSTAINVDTTKWITALSLQCHRILALLHSLVPIQPLCQRAVTIAAQPGPGMVVLLQATAHPVVTRIVLPHRDLTILPTSSLHNITNHHRTITNILPTTLTTRDQSTNLRNCRGFPWRQFVCGYIFY